MHAYRLDVIVHHSICLLTMQGHCSQFRLDCLNVVFILCHRYASSPHIIIRALQEPSHAWTCSAPCCSCAAPHPATKRKHVGSFGLERAAPWDDGPSSSKARSAALEAWCPLARRTRAAIDSLGWSSEEQARVDSWAACAEGTAGAA